MRTLALLAVTILLASRSTLLAQQAASPEPPSFASDSVLLAVKDMGKKAADGTRVDGYFLGGFVGGLVLGFPGAAYLVVSEPNPDPKPKMGGGLLTISAVTLYAARSPVKITGAVQDELRARASAEQEGFRHSYTQRVRQRRRDAALVGGLAGTAVGAVALLALVAGLESAY